MFLSQGLMLYDVVWQAEKEPLLTVLQKKKRLRWAMEHKDWHLNQWAEVIFSLDESKFEVAVRDTRMRVLRTKSEAFHEDSFSHTVKFPASVMVWGCIGRRGPGKLHLVNGTINALAYQGILETNLLPSIPMLRGEGEVIFQQDGATCHTARTTRRWLEEHSVPVLQEWSPSSPDFNPIESVWHKMKKRLRQQRPRSLGALRTKLPLV